MIARFLKSPEMVQRESDWANSTPAVAIFRAPCQKIEREAAQAHDSTGDRDEDHVISPPPPVLEISQSRRVDIRDGRAAAGQLPYG
jgi:hypothetical protein